MDTPTTKWRPNSRRLGKNYRKKIFQKNDFLMIKIKNKCLETNSGMFTFQIMEFVLGAVYHILPKCDISNCVLS